MPDMMQMTLMFSGVAVVATLAVLGLRDYGQARWRSGSIKLIIVLAAMATLALSAEPDPAPKPTTPWVTAEPATEVKPPVDMPVYDASKKSPWLHRAGQPGADQERAAADRAEQTQ